MPKLCNYMKNQTKKTTDKNFKYKDMVEQKRAQKENLNDHYQFNVNMKGLAHSTTIGKLHVELEQKEIKETDLTDSITRLQQDITNLAAKGKKYDVLTAQSVRNMMQMDNFVDQENIR